MRTLNLSGFQPGDNLNISVSQGALTAGPVNVPVWGGAVPSGDITITVDRGEMKTAPESVRLGVDLSGADFDTPAPGPGEYYDARLHELIFLWDLDDSGTWDKPTNMIEAWRAKGTAKGPFVMHVYSQPGTYSPSVLVIEPSSGKTATAVLSGDDVIVVRDPDVVYSGLNTICVNPVGDSDFSEKPTGADEVNLDHLHRFHADWISRKGGAPKRWLFKRGAEFTSQLWIEGGVTPGLCFGAYGSDPARPIIRWDEMPAVKARDTCLFYIAGYGQTAGATLTPEVTFVGLEGRNIYNPATTRTDYDQFHNTSLFIWGSSTANATIHDCDFGGFQATTLNMRGDDVNKELYFHIDDCSITDFGGQYVIFGGNSIHPKSGVALTGCRIVQNVDAVNSDGSSSAAGSSRAIMRSESPRRYHARGNDLYHTDQNQHCLAPFKTPKDYGGIINIHSCVMEGGNGAVVYYANPNGDSVDKNNSICLNAVTDGVIYFSNHTSMAPFQANATGVTIRNCLVVTPSTSRVFGNGNQFSFLVVRQFGTYDPVLVGDAPIRVYNCTYVYEKTDAQTTGNFRDPGILHFDWEDTVPLQNFSNVEEWNNVLHKPNSGPIGTPVTTFAPLTEALLFTNRDKGAKNTDPEFGRERNSSTVLLNGASKTYAYGAAYGYDINIYPSMQTTQAHFAGTTGKEQAFVSNRTFYASKGDFTVVYGPTEITVTNTSGVDWYPNTTGPDKNDFYIRFDMGTTKIIAYDSVPPAGSWKDYKPGPGSAALGAALSGHVSYMDILMQERPEPPSKGAWEVA